MYVRLLGPVELWSGDRMIHLQGARLRAVLATLALHNGSVVPVSRLVDVVWGDDAPATAVGQVHTSVWKLRRLLGEVIETRPPGYVLRLEHGAVDVEIFEERLAAGRAAAAAGHLDEAAHVLRAALSLWRGAALADVPALVGEARRLEERRLVALESRVEADLALGADADLVGELRALTAEFPLSERLHGQLMTVLDRSGRAADALDVYRRLRDRLVGELGLEPMPELRELQQRVLARESNPPPAAHSAAAATTTRSVDTAGRPPETRYVDAGDLHIAYQVLGEGGVDIVLVPGLLSHLDLWWEDEASARFLRGLAAFGRLIVFDKRGAGLSDRPARVQTLEDRMDDIRIVMDAAGSRRAVLVGYSEGGPMTMLYAATYPDRVSSVVLMGAAARWSEAPDYPCGRCSGGMFAALERICRTEWGRGSTIEWYAPSVANSPHARALVGRRERMSVSPNDFLQMLRVVREIDVRPVLASLTLPVLVVQRLDDRVTPPCHGRYLAAHLPNARYVEQPGDHIIWLGQTEPFFAELAEFVAGGPDTAPLDRFLVTVLVAEFVGADEDGTPPVWHGLDAIRRNRGRLVDICQKGVLATFDGPARAIQCAFDLRSAARRSGLELRCGLHVGEAGLADGRPSPEAESLTRRVAGMGRADDVLVSRTVKDLVVGSGLCFSERGTHALQTDAEPWTVYAVALPDQDSASKPTTTTYA